MSGWDDMGTYLERDPQDIPGQLTIDEALADVDEQPSVSITIRHPALAPKGGEVKGYIPLSAHLTVDDLAKEITMLISLGLTDLLKHVNP